MSEDDVAEIVSLSWGEFYGLEAYADEWRTVVPIVKVKVLIKLLKIDMKQVLGPITTTNVFPKFYTLNDFIKARRLELGLSAEEFADKAGFFPVFSDIVESHPLGLELYPADAAVFVAEALQTPSDEFLNWIFEN